MCCQHYKEQITFINSSIHASDPKPIPDEELLQFKNLCVCSVYTSAILNSKIKGNKNEHIDLFSTSVPICTRLKTDFFVGFATGPSHQHPKVLGLNF